MFNRDKSFKIVRDELDIKYGIVGLSKEEYDDLCLRCRKFKVRQIMYREDRGPLDGSRWVMCVQVRDKDIFVAYYTPDDQVTEVLFAEHFKPAESFNEVLASVVRKRKPKGAIESKPDLLEDMKEAGLA